MSDRTTCAACQRAIDASAKLCPYCGANPATGERLDTEAILQEVFKPREMTTSASVLEYARQRQGAVIAIAAFMVLLIMGVLHQFATMRNASAVSDAPAVPLSELTDVTNKPDETTPAPLPPLNFQYDGQPRTMRTYITEPGATTPPEILAEQQAAAQAKAAAAAAAKPQQAAAVAGAQPLRPGMPAPQAQRPMPPPARPPQPR
jgi:hypothetical protein